MLEVSSHLGPCLHGLGVCSGCAVTGTSSRSGAAEGAVAFGALTQ